MTSPSNREEETKQKLKVLVLNFAKGYVRDGDMEKELEAMKWAEEFIDQYAQQVAIEELKGLREATKQMTHVDAHISDISVAQGIRVHTNALLERRIAELKKERKK